MCVQVCLSNVLTYEEREEEVDEQVEIEQVEAGLGSMVDKYGLQTVVDTVSRIAAKGEN